MRAARLKLQRRRRLVIAHQLLQQRFRPFIVRRFVR
jgi:hypothetical protein